MVQSRRPRPTATSWWKKAPSPNFRSWDWKPGPDLTIARYEVYTEGVDQPLATGHTARRGQGAPVLLDWENRTSELLISLDSKLSELAALSAAIDKHAPKDAADPGLVGHLAPDQPPERARHPVQHRISAEPLIVPVVWRDRMQAIAQIRRPILGRPGR